MKKTKICIHIMILCIMQVNAQCPRESIVNDFITNYYGTNVLDPELGWTGNYNNCLPGTISTFAQNNTLARINYFRKLVGVPEVTFDATLSAKCQEAALMMAANEAVSNVPPITWKCYTADGATAALYSVMDRIIHSSSAIDWYIYDNNSDFVANRRKVLYSRAAVFGHGSTPDSDVLWVTNLSEMNPVSEKDICFPPAGFTTFYPIFWSFSHHDADFSGSEVTMTGPNGPMSVTVAPIREGFGDNTIVWHPSGFHPSVYDVKYSVTITNVVYDNSPHTITYDVIYCQPVHPPQCPEGLTWSETECQCSIATEVKESKPDDLRISLINPFSDFLEIRMNGGSNKREYQISVIDINGKPITSENVCSPETGTLTVTVDSGSWKSGIYFIVFRDQSGIREVIKAIKE